MKINIFASALPKTDGFVIFDSRDFDDLKMTLHEIESEVNPFYGFKRLPEDDSYENLFPFSLDEQHKIIQGLPKSPILKLSVLQV